jgi:flavin reductase (DIM6/NTAB) family NADH-FMN oxidoreductase RutF
MRLDFERMPALARFEAVTATVGPRPIALVTSLDPAGRLNAAPYSFFALMAIDPPLLGLGVLPHAEGCLKDTGLNVRATGELVVNLVFHRLAEAMNVTCIDAPPGVDETALAGLATLPSERVAPPRLANSPVAFECRLHQTIEPGPQQVILLVRILLAHVAEGCTTASEPPAIDTPALDLIGAMHGARWYARTSGLFALDRPSWADWNAPPPGGVGERPAAWGRGVRGLRPRGVRAAPALSRPS